MQSYIDRVGPFADTSKRVLTAFDTSFGQGLEAIAHLIHDTAANALKEKNIDTNTPRGRLILAGETMLVTGLLPIHGLIVAYSKLHPETIAKFQQATGLKGRGWVYG